MRYWERIKALREDRDLTQKQVAEVLQTTSQYYQKYEKGIRPLPIERLEKLADFYGVSTDYLLGRTDNPAPPQNIK